MNDDNRQSGAAWQPIQSAPRDGTLIDVWVREFSVGEGGAISVRDVGRYTDIRWGEEFYALDNHPRQTREGWTKYDGGNSELIEGGSYRVTHWMLPPDAPL